MKLMTKMEVFAAKSRYDDRVIVLAPESLSKPMMREGGIWRVAAFSAETLLKDYERVFDAEAEALFQEAKAALEEIQRQMPQVKKETKINEDLLSDFGRSFLKSSKAESDADLKEAGRLLRQEEEWKQKSKRKKTINANVSIERDGDRVMVLSRHLPVPLVREGGIWRVGIFGMAETWDFRAATEEEAEALFQEATAAFWADKERFMAEKKARDAAYEEWKKTKSTEYTVYIDDNFHHMNPNKRITGPTFSTGDEALAECQRIVDRSLRWERLQNEDPNDPEALYERYTAFGDDPFIKANGPDNPEFSAWTYAKERVKEIVKEDINDKELYDF